MILDMPVPDRPYFGLDMEGYSIGLGVVASLV